MSEQRLLIAKHSTREQRLISGDGRKKRCWEYRCLIHGERVEKKFKNTEGLERGTMRVGRDCHVQAMCRVTGIDWRADEICVRVCVYVFVCVGVCVCECVCVSVQMCMRV